MIIDSVSESIRLSVSPMHQGLAVAHQSVGAEMIIKTPAAVIEISSQALKASHLAKEYRKSIIVQPVNPLSPSNCTYHPLFSNSY